MCLCIENVCNELSFVLPTFHFADKQKERIHISINTCITSLCWCRQLSPTIRILKVSYIQNDIRHMHIAIKNIYNKTENLLRLFGRNKIPNQNIQQDHIIMISLLHGYDNERCLMVSKTIKNLWFQSQYCIGFGYYASDGVIDAVVTKYIMAWCSISLRSAARCYDIQK